MCSVGLRPPAFERRQSHRCLHVSIASETRIRDEAGAFRVLYVAKFADAIYVLHCFQKKTERTSKADVELAARRYRELLKERGQ